MLHFVQLQNCIVTLFSFRTSDIFALQWGRLSLRNDVVLHSRIPKLCENLIKGAYFCNHGTYPSRIFAGCFLPETCKHGYPELFPFFHICYLKVNSVWLVCRSTLDWLGYRTGRAIIAPSACYVRLRYDSPHRSSCKKIILVMYCCLVWAMCLWLEHCKRVKENLWWHPEAHIIIMLLN